MIIDKYLCFTSSVYDFLILFAYRKKKKNGFLTW